MAKTKQYFGSTFGSCLNSSGSVYLAKMKYKLTDLEIRQLPFEVLNMHHFLMDLNRP